MEKLAIISDMDDTLCDLNNPWLDRYNLLSGDDLRMEDIKSWAIDSYVKPEWRAKEGEPYWKGAFFQLLFEKDFFAKLPPIDGAIENLVALREAGHEIFIATSVVANDPRIVEGKLEWLRVHAPWVKERNIIFIQRKELLAGPGRVIIDDNSDHVGNFQALGGRGILVDRPWNRKVVTVPDMRMRKWSAVPPAVRRWQNAAA